MRGSNRNLSQLLTPNLYKEMKGEVYNDQSHSGLETERRSNLLKSCTLSDLEKFCSDNPTLWGQSKLLFHPDNASILPFGCGQCEFCEGEQTYNCCNLTYNVYKNLLILFIYCCIMYITERQKDILKRLKAFAETDLEAANRALEENASEYDVRIALYLAKTLGIE